jgi:acetyl esterase/lipase
MNLLHRHTLLLCAVLSSTVLETSAQSRRHSSPMAPASQNCFDPADSQDIRLWEGRAPGAVGDDPCRDIPYLRVFRADAHSREPKPVILVIGGGGYDRLTDTKEQSPVATYFSQTIGADAFILFYRLVQPDGTYRYPVAMWDAQRAIKLLRSRAAQLHIDPDRVAMFGFSAGGHLASTLTLHSATDFDLPKHDAVDSQPGRPNLLGLGYPVISMDPSDVPPSGSYKNLLRGYTGTEFDHLQTYLSGEKNITARAPPVFLFESMDDARISPQNSVLFVAALRAKGIPVDAHLFAHGEHGAGLAEGIPEESTWPDLFHQWLVRQRFVAK